LIRNYAWSEMSLCLVDVLEADVPDLAERPGSKRENGKITPRRCTRETHVGRGQGARSGQLRGLERWLEGADA
jgi:hypothetical protein